MAIKKKKKPNFEFLRETSPSIPLQRGKFRKVDQYRRNPETGQLERYQIEIPIEEKIISQPLKKEFDYYLKNQDELVSKYNGRIVVIKNCQILGDYDSTIEAIEKTSKNHEMGTFLVQKCEPGEESYTVRY